MQKLKLFFNIINDYFIKILIKNNILNLEIWLHEINKLVDMKKRFKNNNVGVEGCANTAKRGEPNSEISVVIRGSQRDRGREHTSLRYIYV